MSSESSSVDEAHKQWMSSSSSSVDDDGDEAHKQWMMKYGITYANSTEMEKRRKIFKKNLEYVKKMNRINMAAGKTYTLGLNDFSDLTDEEFFASHTGALISNNTPDLPPPNQLSQLFQRFKDKIELRRAEQTLMSMRSRPLLSRGS
ncbi:ananain-like [Trifolium pratense]|uniref:ananain-like n=1 Tax=Trifolium pratense TaxID=57577 RepID=UPI001E691F3D|nr:ananain-like [Trifolium pratense]